MNNIKMTAKEILLVWAKSVNEQYDRTKFFSRNRNEILEDLVIDLFDNDIDIEEAKNLKYDIIKSIVHKEGRKGTGQFKDWTKNVESDFLTILLEYYNSNIKANKITKEYGSDDFLKRSDIITAWAKDRFGLAWNEELNLLSHQYNSQLLTQFEIDVFDSNWLKTGINEPAWLIDLTNNRN